MKIDFSFEKNALVYHGTAWIDDGAIYDVTDFYSITEDNVITDLNDWEEFEDEIKSEVQEHLTGCADGYYGGYDNFLEGLDKN